MEKTDYKELIEKMDRRICKIMSSGRSNEEKFFTIGNILGQVREHIRDVNEE